MHARNNESLDSHNHFEWLRMMASLYMKRTRILLYIKWNGNAKLATCLPAYIRGQLIGIESGTLY